MIEGVVIIGASGSGKSTLAKELGDILHLPVTHLDRIKWKPGYESITKVEFDERLHSELMKPKWVLDGNYNRTIEECIKYCDTVVFLDYNRIISIYGVIKRFFMYRRRTRNDIADGCSEQLNFEFLKWVWTFNDVYRSRYLEILSKHKDKNIYLIKSRRAKDRFIKDMAALTKMDDTHRQFTRR